jgi:hypothetical protein
MFFFSSKILDLIPGKNYILSKNKKVYLSPMLVFRTEILGVARSRDSRNQFERGGALRGVTQAETGIGLPSVEEGSSRDPVTMEET